MEGIGAGWRGARERAGASTHPGPLAAAPPVRRPLAEQNPPAGGHGHRQTLVGPCPTCALAPGPLSPHGASQHGAKPLASPSPGAALGAGEAGRWGRGVLAWGKPWGWVCQQPDGQRVLRAHLRGVEDADDAGDDGAVLVLVLLADQLDVPQLAEVEIPLLLQPVHCQLQIHQLRADDGVCAEGAAAPWDPPVPLAVPAAPAHLLVELQDLRVGLGAPVAGGGGVFPEDAAGDVAEAGRVMRALGACGGGPLGDLGQPERGGLMPAGTPRRGAQGRGSSREPRERGQAERRGGCAAAPG